MRSLLLAFLLALGAALPAQAHGLKVFAALEGDTLRGYAYFVGGGRPAGAQVVIRNAAGTEVYRGQTDGAGAFAWKLPALDRWTVVVDTREGHMAAFSPGNELAPEERIRLMDVVGGIGMILGLAGIALWFSAHRPRRDSRP